MRFHLAGNVGVSPAGGTSLTGFALTLDSTGTYYTSAQVTGKLYSASNASPTPSTLTTAVGNLATAYTYAAGLGNPNFLNLGAGLCLSLSA